MSSTTLQAINAMNSDLTFITNETDQTLRDRFTVLVKDTRFFDCLIGYFYASGFHALYQSLEATEKIRILIGISTNRATFDLISRAQQTTVQSSLEFSHAEVKQEVSDLVQEELDASADNLNVEQGVAKFIEWVRGKKLEIRAYPSERLHAKVYIMTFAESDRDKGRVITGSSNFTQAGLMDNLEFNVELKTRSDYEFALQKFNELWDNAVDVSDKYVDTIQTRTWLSQSVSPYQLYLKFLYEYFKDELNQAEDLFVKYLPADFKKLEYQEQAVLNAKKILEEYGGVFISDVVGLGKTYISAMLAGQLDGRTLVVAPPVLLDRNNPGSWPNVFSDFRVPADFESFGKLDSLIKAGTDKYLNVIIDEAHRFRTETTITYEQLAEICRGKRIILVTATPYNNSPKDILSQIKLFQNSRKSTIPNMPDLERFFGNLEKTLKGLDRQKDYEEYITRVKQNAKEIRENILKYLMVRRTRAEIVRYFGDDLERQKLRFPTVEKPEALFYELDEAEDTVFTKTVELITQKFTYSRYTPLLYFKGDLTQPEELSQRNMGKFMKILLVKRLESSFYAFRQSVDRFIHSYTQFLSEYDKGNVYVSKQYTSKIFELLEDGDDEAVQRLIDEGKAELFKNNDFRAALKSDLESDLAILREIQSLWTSVSRDPKLRAFLEKLKTSSILKKHKLIIFTESRETAEYLTRNIDSQLPGQALCFSGGSSESIRDKVIDNFDAKARVPKDDYRILVSTEVLSEGVNLHRSNVVINYDIPWNPTRMMQRVGRVNRVDTNFDKIYTFTFFPTRQSNDQIKLKEAAAGKINAFLTLLGGDAALLTEGEPIGSHELFDRLVSVRSVTGEDDGEQSELKYLQVIKTVRDTDPSLFEQIKHLPKKARTSRLATAENSSLLTYFRRGKLQKFFRTTPDAEPQELDFLAAAGVLEAGIDTPRASLSGDFYEMLDRNKQAFAAATAIEIQEAGRRQGRDSAGQILKIVKALLKDRRQFTDDQEDYLTRVLRQLEEGGLPRQTTKQTLKALQADMKHGVVSRRLLAMLQTNIPDRLLQSHYAESAPHATGKREVILSEFLMGR
jgi:superfamily II DNA or RNA helicase